MEISLPITQTTWVFAPERILPDPRRHLYPQGGWCSDLEQFYPDGLGELHSCTSLTEAPGGNHGPEDAPLNSSIPRSGLWPRSLARRPPANSATLVLKRQLLPTPIQNLNNGWIYRFQNRLSKKLGPNTKIHGSYQQAWDLATGAGQWRSSVLDAGQRLPLPTGGGRVRGFPGQICWRATIVHNFSASMTNRLHGGMKFRSFHRLSNRDRFGV